ncbi:FAD-dependent oxidoreductase [Sphingomonas naphthae]|uniref:FAD-dependent oxidoreductase n=1 Tax=Sphingomonas naphthae TaxID=1813468 RepID=A0ABY7TNN5_9SPHN|nr:FAD-dependent oxidoreductase [Sphingomonas naphthae]WCT74535.1 FAD-dependent oxidoreductase [Sphingomonas naphthae]
MISIVDTLPRATTDTLAPDLSSAGRSAAAEWPVVIVGASVAGLSVAEALRRHGYSGEIVMVDSADGFPGDRPPLSKAALFPAGETTVYDVVPAIRREALAMSCIFGAAATGVDRHARLLRLADGRSLAYSDLVIASGVRPRAFPGSNHREPIEGLHMLRTAADAGRLRAALARGGSIAIVGGGVLGLEVAATARGLGCEASVIEQTPAGLAAKLGATLAQRLLDLHRAHGVRLEFGVEAVGFEAGQSGSGRIEGLRLTDGRVVPASDILVAIGCRPNVEWLAKAGLDLSDGVVCDPFGMAVDHIWAAGDVARIPGLTEEGRRQEHKQNAIDHGRLVAANLLAARAGLPLKRLEAVPYFWTDQFDVKIQFAGAYSPAAREMVVPVEGREGAIAVRFEVEGRLIGAATWNAPKAMTQLRREIELACLPIDAPKESIS